MADCSLSVTEMFREGKVVDPGIGAKISLKWIGNNRKGNNNQRPAIASISVVDDEFRRIQKFLLKETKAEQVTAANIQVTKLNKMGSTRVFLIWCMEWFAEY